MSLRPLGKVKELVESIGMGMSFAYEDLVFLEHNAFILQFGENNKFLIVHTNEEADPEELAAGLASLEKAAAAYALQIVKGQVYRLSQAGDEKITLEFLG